MENEGFRVVTIPAHTYNTCSGCKYHKNQLVRSGRNPQYKRICQHADFLNKENVNAFYLLHGGRIINENKDIHFDQNNETPEWCPFLKQ